jgi:hypothetical protein
MPNEEKKSDNEDKGSKNQPCQRRMTQSTEGRWESWPVTKAKKTEATAEGDELLRDPHVFGL